VDISNKMKYTENNVLLYMSVLFVLSKYKIKKWLQRQETYSLQRPMKRPVKRNRVVVIGIDDQWDVDLMDMTKFLSVYILMSFDFPFVRLFGVR
jgi:hypothetical protein